MSSNEWGLYVNGVCEMTGRFLYLQKEKWAMEQLPEHSGDVIKVRKVTRHPERVEEEWEDN